MFSRRFRSSKSLQRRLTAVGVLGASLALVTTMAGSATSQTAAPAKSIPVGAGVMGAGYEIDNPGAPAPAPQPEPPSLAATVPGIDVSHYQGTINWASVKAAGIQFVWMKATEGTTYKDPRFSANYTGSYNNRIIRGAYHFARPDVSAGSTQAAFFASNGGGWSRDNLTLPGVLDIEGGCYGKSTTSMRTWITDFYNTYKARTGRDVVIYTSPSWWSSCTGSWTGMATKSPLWVAHWTSAASPTVPSGFPFWTVWQYTSTGSVSGIAGNVDRDRFNGDASRLLALANNTA